MLQKWKDIIANWINCYFSENEKTEEHVTLESLLNIISHLRENLSLDESTSSILQANTVEEFVQEKYPDFRFNNGSVVASTDDEIYMVASLLLYFVCVNSKDMDIKHAMCSQLSREDQEIILKFSKCLMECSPVTFKDVQTAITEACGQHTIGPGKSRLVSETPPALRSLHGEVRRLTAALEAERFDRNYLQEELARTNLRVEKLVKDKEQYKLEILNLKAKISMCCGQERDARAGDATSEGNAKLMRDLEETEERLVQTQGQLDDAQYERDTYKAKMNELKQDRDKWVALSQQEAVRASELCSELESARSEAAALSELVAELRQHHRRNALDASQLECDDVDAMREHNTSTCSEACANVIEVQLSEERAKIVLLKQQIESLQDQLNDLTQKYETGKQSLEEEISERDNEIFNLKHRLNEEIEEKNNMTIHYSDALSKLNNEINELEQNLRDNNQQSRIVVEMKMQEIQTLQEEKLSLLQSLTDETNKLENIIQNLKSELEAEKSSKAKMKEDYENRIMKLNEKVLNRNNELVELQNDVFEKSDRIEALHLELRKEKQTRDELVAKHHHECEQMNEKLLQSENTIKLKCEEISSMVERLNYNFEFIKELGCEVDELKYAVSEQSENCKALEQTKMTILDELQSKENKLEELHKHLETMQNLHIEEKDRLSQDLDEASARIEALQMQLHRELQFKISSQENYAQLEQSKNLLSKEIEQLKEEVNNLVNELQHKDKTIEGMDFNLQEEKRINEIVKQECQHLNEEITYLKELSSINDNLIREKAELGKVTDQLKNEINEIQNENAKLKSTLEQNKIIAVAVSEKTGSHKCSGQYEKEYREFHHQVDNTTSDLTHSSMDSIKTISDLEKIITDKNRTITTLQCDITYLKSLIADSENKLLDVTKELEVSKENCQQLAGQLKKIVHQKNEEIAELKKQVNKMSVTENRASQIIKVSAKYQAIILKRIAEIKSNTVLKELTNFGNTANGDSELRRSLNVGTVTMEDLENFLETTDRHLKRCSEKQLALTKERDRLAEVNRINESEIINLKKFLTELSVSFKTFSNVKELYAQKFSRVVSMQRTVRREILSLDGHITDAAMCKLERGYAAVMQDLSECVMNMERWVERSIGRTISPEKIKQAFTNEEDRVSLAATTFQNAGLEVQLEELENSFQKLLEEVVRAQKGEGARDAQSVTVMEVRAEYEDKLNRMKTKMKQLYQEQIGVYKEKQHKEVMALQRELAKTRERLAESSKAYEEHIRALTAELWSVGEKFLTKKDEVDWLRKKQRSGSLMSLQHVHSSGLVAPPEEPSRPSDTHSLRSLPVHTNTNANKRDKEGRGLHMSDEEGEVFDNRWLKELASTPRAPAAPPRDPGLRLSELRWRNSLCPPHLKSSYPAETQFQPALDEQDIKFSLGNTSTLGGRGRKEVGITAYKKPGPPTPSKNAGRLSATDSELRESLRVEAEPQPSRKTSTPSRLRALFRSNKNVTNEGTPRSRRLSIFRKK